MSDPRPGQAHVALRPERTDPDEQLQASLASSAFAAPVDGWDQDDLSSSEHALREALVGVRLVGEINLSQKHRNYQTARRVVRSATRSNNYRKLSKYPAATAVFLVSEGTVGYEEGTFWPHISARLSADPALTGTTQAAIGQAFEMAVRHLGLEDFSDTEEAGHWLRYLTPILLHGGIPADHAHSAAAIVLGSIRDGHDEAAEMIDGTLRSHQRRNHLPMPVKRFFDYGGEFAVDLVQRMITTADDIASFGAEAAGFADEFAAEGGLPLHLVTALLDGGAAAGGQRRRRPPRPHVAIDRYSCDGPYLTLPAVPSSAGGHWIVTGRDSASAATRVKTLSHSTVDLPLNHARGWTVALDAEDARFESHFEGLQDIAAYVFDATGRLAGRQRRLKGPEALILTAPGVQATNDGAPVPQAQQLPDRVGAWQGWKLHCLNLCDVAAVKLADGTPGRSVLLPVGRVASGPEISTRPAPGVTGPAGRSVYPQPPSVIIGDDILASVWRVRWRDDTNTATPATSPLDSLPESLPDKAAFSGILEIAGPLGGGLRDRIAVVRDITAAIPDRVATADETVEVVVTAKCQLLPDAPTTREDAGPPPAGVESPSTSRATLCFAPGQHTATLTANGVPLTVTIPRLAWAIQHRNGPRPEITHSRQCVGLDEIGSGEAEAVIVRCGRAATLRLEAVSPTGDILQSSEIERAAGPDGRWAFPLPPFRTTIEASRLARIDMVLHADDTSDCIGSIQARYEASDVKITTSADPAANATRLQAEWTENRAFVGRQLRLWSQHRPWESPICIDIPDIADGALSTTLAPPPGPYLAEIALGDDWTATRRPARHAAAAAEATIGSAADSRARLASLSAPDPLEVLELAMAGEMPAGASGAALTSARSELGQALVVLCETGDHAAFKNLAVLASTADGLLAALLADDLAWSLPKETFRRLVLTLVPIVLQNGATTPPDTLQRLWSLAPAAAAALDATCDDGSSDRWVRFTGWDPHTGLSALQQPEGLVIEPMDTFTPDRLRDLAAALPATGSLPLQLGGFHEAAWEMLSATWSDRQPATGWRSRHHEVISKASRLSTTQQQQVESLHPSPGAPAWQKLPGDLLAVVSHLIDDPSLRRPATEAVMDAYTLVPRLATRSVLTAIAAHAARAASPSDKELIDACRTDPTQPPRSIP